MTTVYLGSESELKRSALAAILADGVFLRHVKTQTRYVQPIGVEQARLCIAERLAQALTAAGGDSAAVAVAIENYVERGADGNYYDACAVGVQRFGSTEVAYSAMPVAARVAVPAALTPEIDQNAPPNENRMERTCGQQLHRHLGANPAYSHQDWFVAAGSKFGRAEQISMVLGPNRGIFDAQLLKRVE